MTDETPQQKPRSRKFYWWFIGIQLVPLVGILFLPSIAKVWVLIVFANTCVFFFNLGRHEGSGVDADAKSTRVLLWLIGVVFGAMTIAWGARLAVTIYQSGSLNV